MKTDDPVILEMEKKHAEELERQRERNGGKLDSEIRRDKRLAQHNEKRANRLTTAAYFLDALAASRGSFSSQLTHTIIEYGRMPWGRGKDILINIAARHYGGREGTGRYREAHKEATERFEQVRRAIK